MKFEINKFNILLRYLFIIILSCIYIVFEFHNKISTNNKNDFDLVIPSSYSDINLFLRHIKFYKKFLNFSNVVLIAPSNISKIIINNTVFSFIPEEKLFSKKNINDFLWKKRAIKTRREGWYQQQFLKMAYSRICKKKYYLVYDTDTIPIKKMKLFENNRPFFDMKTEHHIPYFNTLNRLIPGLNISKRSYISEHMMIKTILMKNLLNTIEMNYKIPGKLFWEKILMAIDDKDMNYSGFSEYEAYGSYVDNIYPNIYKHREWRSKRDAITFLGSSDNLSEEDINWLSQNYYALSFEKCMKFNKKNLEIIKDKKLQNMYKPQEFFDKFNYLFIKHNQSYKNQSK